MVINVFCFVVSLLISVCYVLIVGALVVVFTAKRIVKVYICIRIMTPSSVVILLATILLLRFRLRLRCLFLRLSYSPSRSHSSSSTYCYSVLSVY